MVELSVLFIIPEKPQPNHSDCMIMLLGAICGSSRSMDRAAQSMDPYLAQQSMDRAR